MSINIDSDLKQFTAAALTGILANPSYNTIESHKHLTMKNLTVEKLALLSAIETLEQIEMYRDILRKQEENKEQIKLALVEDPDIPS